MSKEKGSFEIKQLTKRRTQKNSLPNNSSKKHRSKSSTFRIKKAFEQTSRLKKKRKSLRKNTMVIRTGRMLTKAPSLNDIKISFTRKKNRKKKKIKKQKNTTTSSKFNNKKKRGNNHNRNGNEDKNKNKSHKKNKKKKLSEKQRKQQNAKKKMEKNNSHVSQKHKKNKRKEKRKRKPQNESLKLLKKLLKLQKENQKYETQTAKLNKEELNNLIQEGSKNIKQQTLLGNELRLLLKKSQTEKQELTKELNGLIKRQLQSNPEEMDEQTEMFQKKTRKIQKLEKEMKKIKMRSLTMQKTGVVFDSEQQLKSLLRKLKKITKDCNQYRNDLNLKTSEYLELQQQLEQRKLENSNRKNSNELILIKQSIQDIKISLKKKNSQIRIFERQKRDLLKCIQKKNNDDLHGNFNKLKFELNKKSEINNQLRSLKNQLIFALNDRSEEKSRNSDESDSDYIQSEFEESKSLLSSKSGDIFLSKNHLKSEVENFSDDELNQNLLIKDHNSENITKSGEKNIHKHDHTNKNKNGEGGENENGNKNENENENENEKNSGNEKEKKHVNYDDDDDDDDDDDESNSEELMVKDEHQINSLESLFSIPIAIDYFKEFLFEQLNQENVLFYLDVVNFKQRCSIDKKLLKKLAKIIYEKYIKNQSIFEINIDFKCRALITSKIKNKEYSIDMFDKAREIVYIHMNLNSFEEFKKSKLYQDFLNQSKKNKGESYEFKAHKTAMLVSRGNEIEALNLSFKFKRKVSNGTVVSTNLIQMLIELVGTYSTVSSKEIDFQLLSRAISFHRFVDKTTELQKVKLRSLNEKERTIFFLNVYNCLIYHSAIINGIPNNDSSSRKKFFHYSRYSIGGMLFSLDDIRYGILRENVKFNNKKKIMYFGKDDKRTQFSVRFDKRILFSLNDFELSDFRLIPFNVQNLNQQLSEIANLALNRHITINKSNKKIYIPRVFKKYAKSFGKNDKLFLNWIIKNIMKNQNSSGYSVKFTLNPLFQSIIIDNKLAVNRYSKKIIKKKKKIILSSSSPTIPFKSNKPTNFQNFNKQNDLIKFSKRENNLIQGSKMFEDLDPDSDEKNEEMQNTKSKKIFKIKNKSIFKFSFTRSMTDSIVLEKSKN
ncbi:electron carrier/ protein disulfide oxidoreductase [Anaeramoeba flamelloides]|uniref:Electron carrier/ protein disulfide oxidoreductase n=1 Tax=Anaeramoeba flamelloides TaxID=1746091 RepID=A0AAV8ADW9_9EUKA|nr:electron carrier/ protein disulfide oxidoreductase [Anaeramoeba flamelloides]